MSRSRKNIKQDLHGYTMFPCTCWTKYCMDKSFAYVRNVIQSENESGLLKLRRFVNLLSNQWLLLTSHYHWLTRFETKLSQKSNIVFAIHRLYTGFADIQISLLSNAVCIGRHIVHYTPVNFDFAFFFDNSIIPKTAVIKSGQHAWRSGSVPTAPATLSRLREQTRFGDKLNYSACTSAIPTWKWIVIFGNDL